MNDVTKDLLEALLKVARMAEDLKKPCGMDPESPQAIRNAQYMNISYAARSAIARAEAALAATRPDSDGWIPWSGGECPVDPEAYVQVRYEDGVIDDELQEAEYFDWEHSESIGSSVFNISAYRVFVPRNV